MRHFQAALLVFSIACCSSPAWSQVDDPFGGPGAAADPFAPKVRPAPVRRAPQPGNRDALVQKAKQALTKGRDPVTIAPARHNEAELRIKQTLGDETSVTFIETPLAEALQYVSSTHDIPVIADKRALEEIGLTVDAPVTLDLKNVTLRSALRLMLRPLDLTYLVKSEVLIITTMEAAEENLILEMYALPDNLAPKADQVIKVLTNTVVPDTWDSLGGPSTAMSIDHVIVVSTTSDVHAMVEEFLGKLIQRYGK